ncbi:type IV secretion system DNA-binding domain-containing protein [Candidatus Nomurabacteria bacterium]|nr:type IV secretion system DNA-binding domain-containing protein [Candidatus Nomurabacteria bacterium]
MISLEAIILISIFLLLAIALVILFFWYKKNINKNPELEMLLLKVPRYTKKDQDELNKDYINGALGRIENLFTALAGLKSEKSLKKERIFSLEMVAFKGIIYFYVAVPKKLKEFFLQQFQSVYPKVYFEEISDYNIFEANSVIKAGALKLKKDSTLPIKTYHVFENDPLESITNALSKLNEHESASIQYVFKSAPKAWHSRARKIVRNMQDGESLQTAVSKAGSGKSIFGFFSFLGSFFNFASPDKNKDHQQFPLENKHQSSAKEQEISKLLEDKNSKPALDVNLRVVVSSNSKERSEAVLEDILNSYAQYNIYEFGNSFEALLPKKSDKLIDQFIFRQFIDKNSFLLNSEEMVSVIHLPLPTTETPNIAWLEAVKAPPPSNMPQDGLILGKSSYRGRETLVRIKSEDRRRHMYVIGQTGTGKSVFQESLIIQDIKAGKGVCVVDPHGDLVEVILTQIPKERAEDVILFDPANSQRPLGMNMLEYETEEQKTFVINEMIAIFDKLYDLKATGGPMFEQYMRNAMLLVMDDKESGATLLEIPKILADAEYRKKKLETVKNVFVKDFWEKEAQKAGGDAALANMVPYITSKLTPFISNDLIRPIIAQSKSAFNFREAMDSNKIVLLNLSKGKIGETNSSLLGMVVIGKLLFAAMSRVDTAEEDRKDFYLYIDEFQNFITDTVSVILSEARKYKLNLILAHQFIAQLVKSGDTRTRDAIFGNVGTLVSFRIGVEDSEIIAKQMAPVVSEYDLINMPKYTCYVKLLIDNTVTPAFNFQPIKPEKGHFELAQAIKELSALKYGRDRKLIEEEVVRRLKV